MRSLILSTLLLASAFTPIKADVPINIFVAAANGQVHTVSYTTGNLTLTHTDENCGARPSWLSKGLDKTRFWCWSEGNATSTAGIGSVSRHDIQADGSLKQALAINTTGTLGGMEILPRAAVHGGLALQDKFMVSILYSASGSASSSVMFYPVSNGILQGPGSSWLNEKAYTTGAGLSQIQSHMHSAANDPSNNWTVVTDLGFDKLFVYGTNADGLPGLAGTYVMAAGTGPRHSKFYTASKDAPIYLFIVGELSNTITTLNVTYAHDSNQTLLLSETSRVHRYFRRHPPRLQQNRNSDCRRSRAPNLS